MEYIEIDGEYFILHNDETDPNGEPVMVPISQEEYVAHT